MKRTTFEPDTLAGRLQVFFEANPDEELSTGDICAKYGVTRHAVRYLHDKPGFISELRQEKSPFSQKLVFTTIWRYQR